MSDSDNIAARILLFFSDRMSIVVPSEHSELLKEGHLDSLSFVDLLLYLEEEFGVSVSLEDVDLADFASIARIAGFIRGQIAVDDRSWQAC